MNTKTTTSIETINKRLVPLSLSVGDERNTI